MRNGRWLVIEIALALIVGAVLVTRAPTVEHFLANSDHGYALAAGAELLRGRFPGVDIFINYGPLAVVLSAATLHVSGGDLVVEVLLCAAAWAVTIGIVFRLCRRNFGASAAWCAAGFAYLCIPRFHKWWVWLVPLAALAAIASAETRPGWRRWFISGGVCGMGALLRPDLGVATLAALLLLALMDGFREHGLSRLAAWVALGLGCALPAAFWAIVVVAAVGTDGLVSAVAVLPEMVTGTVASLSLPPPPFRLDEPFTPVTAHALALRLLPAIELVAIVLGWWLLRDRRQGREREGRALLAIGVMGFASYHHTVYRADIHHLWQGIWPLTLIVPALVAVAVRSIRAAATARSRLFAGVIGLVAVLAAVLSTGGLLPILRLPHFDLAPYGRPPLAGLQALRLGAAAAPQHPYAQLVQGIDRLTAPPDEILVLVYGPQLLVFAQRPTSGPTVCFQAGLFDSPVWRSRRLAQLQRRPPALVVVPLGFWQFGPDDELRASLPEIYDFVRTHYRQVVDRQGRYMLLAPDPSFRPPTT